MMGLDSPTWDLILGPLGALVLAVFFLSVTLTAVWKGWVIPSKFHKERISAERETFKLTAEAIGSSITKKMNEGRAEEVERAVERGIEKGVPKAFQAMKAYENGKTKPRGRKKR